MKKLMKSLMLFAAAAMALTSCENEAMNEGIEANDTYTMTFVAGAPESKTSVDIADNIATFSWAEEGETFTFVQNTAEGLKKGTDVTFNNNEGLAEITATFTEATSPIVAIYPEDAYVSDNDKYNKVKLIVRKDQDILNDTFDPNADLMISKEVTPENATDTHLLQFTRLVAVGKMTLKNLPVDGTEIIEKVNFSISSENALTGRLYVDLATGIVEEWGYYNNAAKEVNLKGGAVTAATENDFFFTCMPAIVADGEIFTVTVTTDKSIYTHTVTIPAGKSIEFKSGRVSSFGVNMADAQKEANPALALPWIEGFDDEDLSAYTVVNGDSDTKIYTDGNLALGAEVGEILIGKNGGSMSATFASDGTAKTLNLWFKSNYSERISVSSTTDGVTITKLTNNGYTVALTEGVEQFNLTLSNDGTSGNARVDDITLTEEAPVIEKLMVEGAILSFTAGSTFATGEDFTVTAVYQNGTTETVTADVDSSAVNMTAVGIYTVTVSYEGVTTTYDVTIQANVQTKTIELATGTFANNTITWTQDGVTVVQAQGSSSSAVSSSYATASTMRLYQGHTLTFSCDTNITKIEMVSKSSNYGKTATVNVGTLNNPKTNGCTLTWTGSAKEIVLTNGTGSGGSQLRTSSITITYEVSGSDDVTPDPTPDPEDIVAPTITIDNISDVTAAGIANATQSVGLGSPVGEWTYTVTSDAEWLSNMSLSEGNVIYTVAANNSDARTATVTITASCNGQDDVTKTFTIAQLAGGGDVTTPTTVEMDINGTTGTLAGDSNSITWTSGDVTFTNTKGSTAIRTSDSSHYRAYSGSGMTISVAEGTISKVVITCLSDYQDEMETSFTNAGYTVSTSGTTVTVTGSGSSFTATASAQTRLSNIAVTYTK